MEVGIKIDAKIQWNLKKKKGEVRCVSSPPPPQPPPQPPPPSHAWDPSCLQLLNL